MEYKGRKEPMKSKQAGKTKKTKIAGEVQSPVKMAVQSETAKTTKIITGADSKLTPADIEKFREILLKKRQELVGDLDTMNDNAKSQTQASGDASSMPIHMADIGSDNYEQEMTMGFLENEHSLLKEIDEALGRIAKGTYGICLATGKPIGKARLKLKPWAKYCIEHSRAMEKGSQGR